ncbi:MAG: hypothetical protein NT150_03015 [Bacteroidetes bacterium]|nr:hypothetical protein [Bacteroidota bacterium]
MSLGKNWTPGSPELKKKRNTGVIIGALFPMLVFPVVVYVFYLDSSKRFAVGFQHYLHKIFQNIHNLSNVTSLSVLGNLVVFFLMLRRSNDWGARGVLVSTLFYVVLVFILKIFEGGI